MVAQIGVLASEEEVRRFGEKAKHIKAIVAKTTNSRSFVEVIRESKMDNRGGGRGNFHRGCDNDHKDFSREDCFLNRQWEGEFDRQGER